MDYQKKNIITKLAKFENIVYLHDYITFEPNWYSNFINFGEDWDVCMNSIINTDDTRFRDWTLWGPKLIPYEDGTRTKEMYVSGSYFCAKKHFMATNQFNETLIWGQGEDVEWSLKCRDTWNYKCNSKSIVKFLKQKYMHPNPK